MTNGKWKMMNGKCSLSSLRADQVLIYRAQVIVDRGDGLDFNIALRNDLVKQEIESIRVACLYKQAMAIVMVSEPQAPALVEIVADLPGHPTTDDQALIAAALKELHERPLEVDSGHADILAATIEYAVRHGLRPLDGLAPAVAEPKWIGPYTRAKLARALGQTALADEIDAHGIRPLQGLRLTHNGVEWDSVCGGDICRGATADVNGPLSVTLDRAASDEVPPYVECYVDDALVWEGPIAAPASIALAPAGQHRVELRIANPLTRNHEWRRIRIL